MALIHIQIDFETYQWFQLLKAKKGILLQESTENALKEYAKNHQNMNDIPISKKYKEKK